MTGGLAAALLPIVEKSGAIWVGSSGRVRDGNLKEPFAEIEALGTGALAMLDLPAAHYGGYYEGFANSALWPALHSRADLIRATQEDYLSYREVNAFMARALLRFRKTDSAFWIQDYHFLALGAELRDLGVTEPIGFFLHTPWPSRAVISGVPHHRELIEAMLAYDLIGFQTEEDCENFLSYAQSDLGLVVHDGVVISRYGRTRAAVFPIGIDPGAIRPVGGEGVDPSGRLAAAAQPERREARDRRRPAGLFQGPDQPHQGVRPDVDAASVSLRARRRCCRSQRPRAARSRPTAICRTMSPGSSATSTASMARSTGRRSAISTRATARPCSRASIAPRRSAW